MLAIGQIIFAFAVSVGQTRWRSYTVQALVFLLFSVKAKCLGAHLVTAMGLIACTVFAAYAMVYGTKERIVRRP